jgi:hypothetical protein
MKELFSTQVIIGIATIIGFWIGYKIKSIVDLRKEFVSKASEKRRRMYQDFLKIIFDLLDVQKIEKNRNDHLQQIIKRIHDFYTPLLLYASTTTVNLFGEFMQFLYAKETKDPKELFPLLGKVIFSMRKDIGLSNKGLQEIDLFKPILIDYKQFFGK